MPPFASLTKTWHNASYPEISPSRPELSVAGRTVAITGGGTGIGAGIAIAFAAAGSKNIALLGRRVEPLKATADKIKTESPNVHILILSVDVTALDQVDAAFDTVVKELGPIDILISNAGYCTDLRPVSDLDPVDAWTAFDVHVKGNFNVARAFRRTASKEGAVAIHVSSMAAVMPAFPGGSAYSASKLAATKIWDYFGFENPDIRVVNIQPGTIQTAMADKIGVTGADDVNLAGHFAVWLASPEAGFLNGKFVCANWDVTELMARKEELEKTELLNVRLQGHPPMV